MSSRFGVPEHLQNDEKRFLVIGYGKLGSIELGYKSDLRSLGNCVRCCRETQTTGRKKVI